MIIILLSQIDSTCSYVLTFRLPNTTGIFYLSLEISVMKLGWASMFIS